MAHSYNLTPESHAFILDQIQNYYPMTSCIPDKRDFWESGYDIDIMSSHTGSNEFYNRAFTYMLTILEAAEV